MKNTIMYPRLRKNNAVHFITIERYDPFDSAYHVIVHYKDKKPQSSYIYERNLHEYYTSTKPIRILKLQLPKWF